MARLDNKVALITGGESGIGLACARLFVAEGASVHLAGLARSGLEAAVAELGPDVADFSVTDVTVEDQVAAALRQAAARFGGLDICSATRVSVATSRRSPTTRPTCSAASWMCTCWARSSCSSTGWPA